MKQGKKKRKCWNKILACLAAMLMLIGCLPGAVQADNYLPDEKGSFELTLQESDEDGNPVPLAGVGLKLYQVSTVEYDGNVHFVINSDLTAAGVAKDIDFDKLDGSSASVWLETADTLSRAVDKISLKYQEGTSDAQGKVTFSDLEQGMYLVVQSDPDGKVTVSPMLLSIPFAQDGVGWTYQVQAYPKCASNKTETAVNLTKRIYYIDTENDYAQIPMTAEDATYKVGIFLDKDGTIPFRSDYIREIHIQNSDQGSVSYSNIPDGTYYVYELDENNEPMNLNESIEVESGKFFEYNVTDSSEKESNTATVKQTSTPQTLSYVNNKYFYIPDGFLLNAKVSITKKVLVDGRETTTDDTFYAGIFQKESDGSLTLIRNVKLTQNGTVTEEFALPENSEPDSITYTVMETDKDGNILDADEFPYEISGEGDVELKRSEQYKGEITLTNSKNTSTPTITSTPSPTKTPTSTPAPGNGDNGSGGNTPRTGGSDGTSRHSVKTGDNTNIAVWVVLLAAAVVIIGFVGYRSRKKKK